MLHAHKITIMILTIQTNRCQQTAKTQVRLLLNIKIFNGSRWPNTYPSKGIFNLHLTTIMDSFSCIHFLRKLYLNFQMHYYINIMLKYLHFKVKTWQFGFYLRRWHWNVWRKNVETFGGKASKTFGGKWHKNQTWLLQNWRVTSKWHPDIMHESHVTITICKTTFPSPGRVHRNSCQVCKKKSSLIRIYTVDTLL